MGDAPQLSANSIRPQVADNQSSQRFVQFLRIVSTLLQNGRMICSNPAQLIPSLERGPHSLSIFDCRCMARKGLRRVRMRRLLSVTSEVFAMWAFPVSRAGE